MSNEKGGISIDIENQIRRGIEDAMSTLLIDRMPTSNELRTSGFTWLDSAISRNNGLVYWAKEMNLPTKHKRGKKLSEDKIKESIYKIMKDTYLNRMPSTSEITNYEGNHILHNNIVRQGGYRHWAEKLGLELKDSETKLGQDYELIIEEVLIDKGFKVEKMSTGHPFDLLIDGAVKVDVKAANPHLLRGESRVHTFGINKSSGSCDIYIAVAINESKEIEKTLIIPSHHLKIITLCIGRNSKYDRYNNRFDYIKQYSEFIHSIN